MKFIDGLLNDALAGVRNAFPVTSDHRVVLNSRLTAYERDKNRGRLASDVLAEVHRRLRARTGSDRPGEER